MGRSGHRWKEFSSAAIRQSRFVNLAVGGIGAVVNASIGLGAGAKEAIEKHDAELNECLRDKGYIVTG